MSAPSPTPAAMPPPPTLKRPRQSAAGTSTPTGNGGPGGGGQASNPRVKRRKNEAAEEAAGADSSDAGGAGRGAGKGGAAGKGKDDGDNADSGEIQTKIDFRNLPDETLWKYLEVHDLLPRWDVSPWSEDPCVPPNALYRVQAQPTVVPVPPAEEVATSAPSPAAMPQKPEDQIAAEPSAQTASSANIADATSPSRDKLSAPWNRRPDDLTSQSAPDTGGAGQDHPGDGAAAGPEKQDEAATNGDGEAGEVVDGEDTPAPPTTRSKTAPTRKEPTPDASPAPSGGYQRPVITLSDVMAARDVLAEKANAHWIKGLGGGQNKEGETIVNFLYKLKVGPGRLLRVYNPPAPPHGSL